MHLGLGPVLGLTVVVASLLTAFGLQRYASNHEDRQKAISANTSAADFRIYNRLADEMSYYHSYLRQNWDELYAGTAPNSMVPGDHVIRVGIQFCNHLKAHHDIEEAIWFPILAEKMKGFQEGEFAKLQHEEMHKGLDVLLPYLTDCKVGRQDYRREQVRDIMYSFGTILWNHMDDEVRELQAENMRKYWTVDEMRHMPF